MVLLLTNLCSHDRVQSMIRTCDFVSEVGSPIVCKEACYKHCYQADKEHIIAVIICHPLSLAQLTKQRHPSPT